MNNQNQFDRDTLAASDAAYRVDLNDSTAPVTPPEGWEWKGNFTDPNHSFQAAVFERTRDGRTERMYAIAGVEPRLNRDRLTDLFVASGLGQRQAGTDAFRLMAEEATELAGSGVEITFAGHSMGGGLASIAAYQVQYALESSDEPSETEPGRIRMRSWNGFGTVEYFEAFENKPDGIPFDTEIAGRIDAVTIRTDEDRVSPIGTQWSRVQTIPTTRVEIRQGPRGVRRMRVPLEGADAPHGIAVLKALVGGDGSGLDNATDEDALEIRGMLSGNPLVDAIRDFDPFELDDPERTSPGARRDSELDRETGEAGTDTQESARPAALELSTQTNLSAPPGQGQIRAGTGETVFSVADAIGKKLGRTVTAAEIRALNALQASAGNGFREGEPVRVPGLDGAGAGRGPGDVELGAGARLRDLGESQAKLLEKKLGRSLREIGRDPALQKRAKALFRDGFVRPAGADGLPKALGRRLTKISAGHGPKAAARTLQQAANRLGAGLRVDGVAGPRTRTATAGLLRTAGEGAMEEAMAFSRFRSLAGGLTRGPADPDRAGRAFDVSLGKLFPGRRASKPREEVRLLQEATNDASRFAGRKPELRIDGILGPRTATAMTDAIRAKGVDDFTDDLAGRFGFFPTPDLRWKPAPGRPPRSF